MSAVGWLEKHLKSFPHIKHSQSFKDLIEQAKQMEMEKCIQDYNAGYDDAQCNHINDAKNYANEQKYLNSNE